MGMVRNNQSPAQSFGNIFWIDGLAGLTTSLQTLGDGYGTNSILSISQTQFNIDRSGGNNFLLDGVALTVSATTLNNYQNFSAQPYVVAAGSLATLPNSIVLGVAPSSGLTITQNLNNLLIGTTGNLNVLANLTGAGILVQTSTGHYSLRNLTSEGTITITNPEGVAGNPVLNVNDNTSTQKLIVSNAGTATANPRHQINFIGGLNTTITTQDNVGTDSTDVTITGDSNPWLVGTIQTVGFVTAFVVTIPIVANTNIAIMGLVSAIDTTGAVSFSGQFSGGAYRLAFASGAYQNTAINTFVYPAPPDPTWSDASFQYVNISTVGTNLVIAVTGLAGKTINWKCSYHYTVQGVV